MEAMDYVYAALAGLSVVVSSEAARRFPGRVGGVLAAAPVTPTFAVLAMGAEPAILPQGLPVVAITAAIIVVALGARLGRVMMISMLGLAGPLGWTAALLALAGWGVAAPVASARPRGIAWPLRFAIGAGVVLGVAAVARFAPSLAPYLAMAPWLFIAAIVAAGGDNGLAGIRRVLCGGIIGTVGVAAFAWTAAGVAMWLPVPGALLCGWAAYALIALLWPRPIAAVVPRQSPVPQEG